MRRKIVVAVLLALGVGCSFTGNDPGDDGEPIPPDDPTPPGPGPGPGPGPTTDPLQAFSGCPQVDDLVDTDFADKWSKLSAYGGNCQACHSDASSGYEPIFNDPVTALDQMTTSYNRIRVYFAVEGGSIVVNEQLTRVSEGGPPYAAHPRYDLEEDGALEALYVIYDRAMARSAAGTCGPPRY